VEEKRGQKIDDLLPFLISKALLTLRVLTGDSPLAAEQGLAPQVPVPFVS